MFILVLLARARFTFLFARIAWFRNWFVIVIRFPFSLIFFLVSPIESCGHWFFTFNFTDGVTFSFAMCNTLFFPFLAPFVISTYAFLTMASSFITILIISVVTVVIVTGNYYFSFLVFVSVFICHVRLFTNMSIFFS
jgi:hypothetical protein